ECDLSSAKYARLGGDNDGASTHVTLLGLDLHPPAPPIDALHWRRKLDGQTGSELRQQRANPLAAEEAIFTLLGSGKIDRGHFLETLAAPEGAQHEFQDRAPLAQISRQRLGGRHVASTASRIADGTLATQPGREKLFHFRISGIAQPDPQTLVGRGGIDAEAGPERELRDRIYLLSIEPMRAAIVRHAERVNVSEAAPCHTVARLEHRNSPPRGSDAAGRSNAGRPGANDDDIEAARCRHGNRGMSDGRGQSSKKRAAVEPSHDRTVTLRHQRTSHGPSHEKAHHKWSSYV